MVVVCATIEAIDLPVATRVLVNAQVTAAIEAVGDANKGEGSCFIGTSDTGPLPNSRTDFILDEDFSAFFDQGGLVAVTPLVGPGPVSFGVDCNQDERLGAINYSNIGLTAVTLSPE